MRWRGQVGERGLTWLRRQLGLGLPASWSSIVGRGPECRDGLAEGEPGDLTGLVG